MRLVPVWLHVIGVVVWIGGLMYQTHVLLPAARRGNATVFAEAAARGRPAAWTAVVVIVLTGFYNVTQMGPAERVMQTGAGTLLAGKFILVIAAIILASQRDFIQVPRLRRARDAAESRSALSAIAWLDRLVLFLAVAIVWLGLAVARA